MPTGTYDLIASGIFSSAATTYSVSGIPNTYTDLVITVTDFRGNGNTGGVLFTFNNDTSTSYQYALQAYNMDGSINSFIGNSTSGAAAYAQSLQSSTPAIMRIDVARYADTNYRKAFIFRGSVWQAAGTMETVVVGGAYADFTTISSFQLRANNTNSLSGAKIYVYGIVNV